jgi:hypothetical protein
MTRQKTKTITLYVCNTCKMPKSTEGFAIETFKRQLADGTIRFYSYRRLMCLECRYEQQKVYQREYQRKYQKELRKGLRRRPIRERKLDDRLMGY